LVEVSAADLLNLWLLRVDRERGSTTVFEFQQLTVFEFQQLIC